MLPQLQSKLAVGSMQPQPVAEASSIGTFAAALAWRPGQDLNAWTRQGILALRDALQPWGLLQAVLYQQQDLQLTLLGGYAMPRNTPRSIALGMGLLGQAARSRQPILQVGNQVALATSSLVGLQPQTWLVLPLVHNDSLVGVLELTLHRALPDSDYGKVLGLGTQLATALDTVVSQLRIQELLADSHAQNQRLHRQEAELHAKINELDAAQRELEAMQAQLVEANHGLEAQVAARTAELESALHGLHDAQDQLILREKMAALGQLVAGVAHEINSPMGAIKASAGVMADLVERLIGGGLETIADLDAATRKALVQLLQHIRQQPVVYLTNKEERQLRRRYAAALEAAGLPEADELAVQLVNAGLRTDLDPVLPLLLGTDAAAICELAYLLGQLKVNLDNIDLAVGKTRKVVYALKSYAHTSDSHAPQLLDLRENIETVLTIYANQLKYGIDLQLTLADVPPVMALGDQLSQVWTNLLQNAIQAMGGQGKLAVSCQPVPGGVEVTIVDDGPGIPADIQARIFEPFFTTKKRGEGTGLGLDICRRIVAEHKGTINLESRPGSTCFRVWLPVTANQEEAQ